MARSQEPEKRSKRKVTPQQESILGGKKKQGTQTGEDSKNDKHTTQKPKERERETGKQEKGRQADDGKEEQSRKNANRRERIRKEG